MSKVIKAGIPHVIKVNTKADQMGIASGFKLKYFDDASKSMVDVAQSFFEFVDTIVPTSTTVAVDATAGDTTLELTAIANFESGKSLLINGAYHRIVSVSGNVVTLKKALSADATTGDTVDLVGNTGTYGVEVTFPAKGEYTLHVTNFAVGMDNEAAPVSVADATIDDVKTLLDSVSTEVTSVKSQVDTLDEAELNGISEKVDAVQATVSAIDSLVKDTSDKELQFPGDARSELNVGDVISNQNNQTGTIQYIDYNAEEDRTYVAMVMDQGPFNLAAQPITNTTTTLDLFIQPDNYSSNGVNSVIEFVEQIRNIINGVDGFAALKDANADVEAMLNGTVGKLSDGVTDNPTAGKGLVAIFDEIAATYTDVTAIKALTEDATNGFAAIRTAIDNTKASVEAKIDSLVNESNADSLISKVNSVKTVVDANKTLLEGANGLANIMTAITDMDALFQDGGAIENRFDTLDTANNSLQQAITNQTTHLDSRFDSVMNELQGMNEQTQYAVFA